MPTYRQRFGPAPKSKLRPLAIKLHEEAKRKKEGIGPFAGTGRGSSAPLMAPAQQLHQRQMHHRHVSTADANYIRQQALLQHHAKLEYERELARQRGDGAKVARLDAQRVASMKNLRVAGIGQGHLSAFGRIAGRTLQDLATAAYQAPSSAIVTGRSVGLDVKNAAQGDPSFRRTRHLGAAIGKATYADVRHPLRHPGYALLDALGLVSAGVGTGARIAAAGGALRAGEGLSAALARQGYKGGSLLHKPAPGEINLPGGVQALEHDNPLLNVAPIIGKRARMRRVTRAIETGQGPTPLLPRFVGKETTAQSLIGREIRAREAVQSDLANAPGEALLARMKGLTPAQHTATRILAVEGNHALRHPEEAVARQVAVHEGYARKAEARAQALVDRAGKSPRVNERVRRLKADAILNREIAKDLPQALPILKDKPRGFLEAVAAARRESKRQERQLVDAGRLTTDQAKARRAKIAEVYGRNAGDAPRGSFYFPTGEKFKYPTRSVGGGPVSRRPSTYGLSPPDASRYLQGTMRKFTGAGTARGVVQQPGRAIASRGAGLNRLASAERFHEAVLKVATKRRRGERDIEIRATKTVPEDMRRRIAAAAEEAITGDKTAMVRAENLIHEALRPQAGEPVAYLNPDYIKEFATSARGLKALAAGNKPFRFGGVYLRPAYVFTNRPQNFLMRHLAQGIKTRRPIRATTHGIRKELGPEVTAKLDALGGTTRTESYQPSHQLGRVERAVTQKMSDLTDRDERFLAVLARAHEKGYRSIADLRRLVADRAGSKVANDRVAIGRRADKDMIAFRSTTPGERTLSDFIYFYPYLSRGSAWAGRFVAEHPVKSAVIAQAGREAKREGIGVPGPIPNWLQGYISTRLGLSNLNPLSTFSTPAQIGETLAKPSGPQARSFGEEFGSPVIQLMTTKPSQIPKLLERSVAPGLLAQRLGLIGHPAKTFPHTGLWPALLPFIFGGPAPRRADMAQVKKQGLREHPKKKGGHFVGSSRGGGNSLLRSGSSGNSHSLLRSGSGGNSHSLLRGP